MNFEALCPAIQNCIQDLSQNIGDFKKRIEEQKYSFWTAARDLSGIGTLRGIYKDWTQIRHLNFSLSGAEKANTEIHQEYDSLPDHLNFRVITELYGNTQALLGFSYKIFQETSDASKGALISKLVYLGGLGIMGAGASLGSTVAAVSGLGLSALMGGSFLCRANYQDGDFWVQSKVKLLELHLDHLKNQWEQIKSQESAVSSLVEPASQNNKSSSAA